MKMIKNLIVIMAICVMFVGCGAKTTEPQKTVEPTTEIKETEKETETIDPLYEIFVLSDDIYEMVEKFVNECELILNSKEYAAGCETLDKIIEKYEGKVATDPDKSAFLSCQLLSNQFYMLAEEIAVDLESIDMEIQDLKFYIEYTDEWRSKNN